MPVLSTCSTLSAHSIEEAVKNSSLGPVGWAPLPRAAVHAEASARQYVPGSLASQLCEKVSVQGAQVHPAKS